MSSSQEDGPPPKKSRRLATKKKTKAPAHENINNGGQTSNDTGTSFKDQIAEAVASAIPTITQSVIQILQQSGLINGHVTTDRVSPDVLLNTCTANNSTIVQRVTDQTAVNTNNRVTCVVNENNTNTVLNDSSTSNDTSDNSAAEIIYSTNNRFVLEGSREIPLIDLSPSINLTTGQDSTAVNSGNGTINNGKGAPGTQVLHSLLTGEVKRHQRFGAPIRNEGNRCVTPDVSTLKQSAETIIERALMPSSIATYERAISYYKHFLALYFPRAPILPSSVENLTMFIAFCSHNLLACSTVTTYISVLSYLHKLGGHLDVTQSFVVKKALQGLRKMQGNVDTRLPITYSILEEMIGSLQFTCSSFFIHNLLKAMYLFAFHAFLRVGEMTHSSLSAQNNLQFGSITFQFNTSFEPDAVELKMKNFKHSAGKSCHVLVINKVMENEMICPVKALWQYCKLRGDKEGPLFCFMDKTPISRYFFSQQLKLTLSYCNKDIKSYKGHSFRIGAASYAASMGISDEKIQLMGRWNSNAFKKYIRVHMLKR